MRSIRALAENSSMSVVVLEPAALCRCRKCLEVVTINIKPFEDSCERKDDIDQLSGFVCPFCDGLNIGLFGGNVKPIVDDWMQLDFNVH
jgi:hypothetical protein